MITLKISGMSCEHCVRAVDQALKQVPGVEAVKEVSLERGEAQIAGQPQIEQLLEAVRAEGYEVQVE